ncbi:MAG TPA: hypothetical protein VH835_12395 [Dongiaceae bacterium]|jgi:hypothetical protein
MIGAHDAVVEDAAYKVAARLRREDALLNNLRAPEARNLSSRKL